MKRFSLPLAALALCVAAGPAKAPPAPPPLKEQSAPSSPRCFAPYTQGTRDGFLMCNFYEHMERSA